MLKPGCVQKGVRETPRIHSLYEPYEEHTTTSGGAHASEHDRRKRTPDLSKTLHTGPVSGRNVRIPDITLTTYDRAISILSPMGAECGKATFSVSSPHVRIAKSRRALYYRIPRPARDDEK
jgi:hypothetical protein